MERRLRRLEAANADRTILAALQATAADEAARLGLDPDAVFAEALAMLAGNGARTLEELAARIAAGEVV